MRTWSDGRASETAKATGCVFAVWPPAVTVNGGSVTEPAFFG